jgi:holo-[acyl-carrier protein] synthase
MIIGIGVDSVDLNRFESWTTFAPQQLQKIFSKKELAHCLEKPHLKNQRFASIWTTKEALFKALSPVSTNQSLPFLTLCKATELTHHPSGYPQVIVSWHALQQYLSFNQAPAIHISITHTATQTIAFIILEQPFLIDKPQKGSRL